MKYLIIDSRMREVEKEVLKKLEYSLIELPKNKLLLLSTDRTYKSSM